MKAPIVQFLCSTVSLGAVAVQAWSSSVRTFDIRSQSSMRDFAASSGRFDVIMGSSFLGGAAPKTPEDRETREALPAVLAALLRPCRSSVFILISRSHEIDELVSVQPSPLVVVSRAQDVTDELAELAVLQRSEEVGDRNCLSERWPVPPAACMANGATER